METVLISYLNEYGLLSIFAAFAVGVLTSLAPCSIITLPLLVGSAVTLSSDLDEKQKKLFVYNYSSLFVLGLIISFSILMLVVAKVGMMLSVAPFWAYALASLATLTLIAYSLGVFGTIDKDKIAKKFLKYKLFGAVIIGLIFGLVSSPCASLPLVAIITIAEQSGWIYSYFLVLSFAMGHALLLLIAGVSLGFTQGIISSKKVASLSKVINGFFLILLISICLYFIYKTVLSF